MTERDLADGWKSPRNVAGCPQACCKFIKNSCKFMKKIGCFFEKKNLRWYVLVVTCTVSIGINNFAQSCPDRIPDERFDPPSPRECKDQSLPLLRLNCSGSNYSSDGSQVVTCSGTLRITPHVGHCPSQRRSPVPARVKPAQSLLRQLAVG